MVVILKYDRAQWSIWEEPGIRYQEAGDEVTCSAPPNGYFLHIAPESEQPVGHLMTDDEAGSNCSGRGERAQLYTENTALEERRERTRTAGSS